MVKAKQPSKRQRETAARYCDAAAVWFQWIACGVETSDPEREWDDERSMRLAMRIADVVDATHMDRTAGGVLPGHVAWAEAAAWLRSGEDLP